MIVYTGTFVTYGIYEKFGSSFLFLIWFGTGLACIGYVLQNQQKIQKLLFLIFLLIYSDLIHAKLQKALIKQLLKMRSYINYYTY